MVRRAVVWTAATLVAAGVVVIFLIALWPGFVIKDVGHRFVPLNGMSCGGTPGHMRCHPDPSNATNYSAWYSCSQRGYGAGPSSTTEPMVCTPAR